MRRLFLIMRVRAICRMKQSVIHANTEIDEGIPVWASSCAERKTTLDTLDYADVSLALSFDSRR